MENYQDARRDWDARDVVMMSVVGLVRPVFLRLDNAGFHLEMLGVGSGGLLGMVNVDRFVQVWLRPVRMSNIEIN